MRPTRYLPFLRRGLQHGGPPLHLTLFVTGRCNLRCRHCFHWKEVAEGVAGPSVEDVERLADSAARMGPLLWVSFGGGEPFLREDLAELAVAFGKHGLRHLAIPTNGLVARQPRSIEKILAACPDTFLSVGISFDGPPEIHDAIRAVPGGHAGSMAAFRELREQADAEPRLGAGVILTVTRENQDQLADHMEELVRELRPDNVTINLARGTAMDESLLDVDLNRYREVVERKQRLMRDGLLPYFEFPLARLARARDDMMYDHVERVARADREGRDLGRDHLSCTAAKLSAVIYEDGSVAPCEILDDRLGNLNDVGWDLERLWKSAVAERLRKKIRDERCVCTWECAQADNVLFHKRHWPRLLSKVVRG